MKMMKSICRFSTQTSAPEFINYYLLSLEYGQDGYYETCTQNVMQILIAKFSQSKWKNLKTPCKQEFLEEIISPKIKPLSFLTVTQLTLLRSLSRTVFIIKRNLSWIVISVNFRWFQIKNSKRFGTSINLNFNDV